MKMFMKTVVVAAFAVSCVTALADRANNQSTPSDDGSRPWFPIGLSIIAPPVQLPSPHHTVFGAMVNLGYGQVDGLAILDVGIINNVTDSMIGLEVGAVNLAGTCFGAQVGALNISEKTIGLQIGAVNYTGNLHGAQIGLINMSASGGAWVFPIFNLGF